MQIPLFKPSEKFVDDFYAPCLIGEGKNSQLRGVATSHRAEVEEDAPFTVFLRGIKPKEITPWQQEMLDRLFTHDGLVPAIEAGLEAYKKLHGFSEADLVDDLRRDGMLAHVFLTKVIIDDERREVILTVFSIAIGDIGEHGLVIHGPGEIWQIEQLDFISDYLADLDSDPPTEKGADKVPPGIKDLIGVWVMDVAATTVDARKSGGVTVREVLQDSLNDDYEVSDSTIKSQCAGQVTEARIVRCLVDGRRTLLEVESSEYSTHLSWWGGRFRKGKIVDDIGIVWRRAPATEGAPSPAWAQMEPAPLLGRWFGREFGGGIELEITPEEVLVQGFPLRWIACWRKGADILFQTQSPTGRANSLELKWMDGKLKFASTILEKVDDRHKFGYTR